MTTPANTAATPTVVEEQNRRLPLPALVSMALMGFILIAMETMPAGLLSVIAGDLNTSEGVVGLLVSAYALGTVIVTVPAIALTRKFRRKPLLLWGSAGLIAANTVVAFSSDVTLILVVRFLTGAFSGMIWGMLAPYAMRISPKKRVGAALALVSVGAPLGFAFGTPLGTWIGTTFDWRWSFIGLSLLGALVFVVLYLLLPDAPGQPAARSVPSFRVVMIPGVALTLAVIFAWMLGHSTIYTYVAPFLRTTATGITPELMLLVYGVASLVGVVLTGLLLDRMPGSLLLISVTVFAVAGVVMILAPHNTAMVLGAAALWGMSFGGSSAQLQRALSRAGGEHSDVANSFLPVAFNLAIFGAGVMGAALLVPFNGAVLPVVMVALATITLVMALLGRRATFL